MTRLDPGGDIGRAHLSGLSRASVNVEAAVHQGLNQGGLSSGGVIILLGSGSLLGDGALVAETEPRVSLMGASLADSGTRVKLNALAAARAVHGSAKALRGEVLGSS